MTSPTSEWQVPIPEPAMAIRPSTRAAARQRVQSSASAWNLQEEYRLKDARDARAHRQECPVVEGGEGSVGVSVIRGPSEDSRTPGGTERGNRSETKWLPTEPRTEQGGATGRSRAEQRVTGRRSRADTEQRAAGGGRRAAGGGLRAVASGADGL